MHEQQIITTLEALRLRVDERFDTADSKLDEVNDKLDIRLRAVETDIARVKTAGLGVGLILSYLGWDHVKPWLASLMKL